MEEVQCSKISIFNAIHCIIIQGIISVAQFAVMKLSFFLKSINHILCKFLFCNEIFFDVKNSKEFNIFHVIESNTPRSPFHVNQSNARKFDVFGGGCGKAIHSCFLSVSFPFVILCF